MSWIPPASDGGATTDVSEEGGSFNLSFFRRCLLNLTVKNYKNWSAFTEVIVEIKTAYFFLRHRVHYNRPSHTSENFSVYYASAPTA